MPTWTLPIPPSSNHMYIPGRTWGGRRNMRLSDEARAWLAVAALIVRGWQPPARTPLRLTMALYLPRGRMNTTDLSGYEKIIEDATVGTRRDQWVRCKRTWKHLTAESEGWAVVTVETLEEASE